MRPPQAAAYARFVRQHPRSAGRELAVTVTIVVALAFVTLLALEWRYHFRSVRIATVGLALVALYFAQGNLTAARRNALSTPPAERITRVADRPLSEYASGVHTMVQAVEEVYGRGEYVRLLSMGVL